MPSKTETAARRLVAEIHRATGGQPMRWCSLWATSQRAKGDTDAVHYAALKGWIDFKPRRDPQSVTLTDAGRNFMQ